MPYMPNKQRCEGDKEKDPCPSCICIDIFNETQIAVCSEKSTKQHIYVFSLNHNDHSHQTSVGVILPFGMNRLLFASC